MKEKPLYAPYKAVGYVTDGNPFFIHRLGEEIFIYTSIGKSFQVFKFDHLSVVLASRPVPGEISCIRAINHDTFVAVENSIYVFHRSTIVRKYSDHNSTITGIITIGQYLISYDQDNFVFIFDTKARKALHSMKALQSSRISVVAHPATYINKVLIGYENGELELWNFMKKRVIYTFKAHKKYLKSKRSTEVRFDDDEDDIPLCNDDDLDLPKGVSYPAITCIEQSPACDILAVGFSSGDIILLHAKSDEVLFTYQQEGGKVTSLSFRTDIGSHSSPYLASGSDDGRVFIWNLGKEVMAVDCTESESKDQSEDDSSSKLVSQSRLVRKLEHSLDDIHLASVGRVEFLHGEPILVTNSVDNSLKIWIFDQPDGAPRLLRSREGHWGPSVRLRYYGGVTLASMRDNADANSCELISAGSDQTLRYFNTAIEAQNREMSQQPLLKKIGGPYRYQSNPWSSKLNPLHGGSAGVLPTTSLTSSTTFARLPPIVDFDYCETRQRDWGNVVTIHRHHSSAYVWNFRDRVITEMILKQPSWPDHDRFHPENRVHHATAVAISSCGNFATIGTREGIVYRYNLQSGQPRGQYPIDTLKNGSKKRRQLVELDRILAMAEAEDDEDDNEIDESENNSKNESLSSKKTSSSQRQVSKDTEPQNSIVCSVQQGHQGDVSGLFIDITNTIMVSSGIDGQLIFWDFHSQQFMESIVLTSPIRQLVGFREGNYVAIVTQDHLIRVYDLSSRKLARRFLGHDREISDVAFTPDGKRLVSCSLDGSLRTWDMLTGKCLSWVLLDHPVLSMAMSLSGDHVVVSQSECPGFALYLDRSLYETVHFWKEPTCPTRIQSSAIQVEEDQELIHSDDGLVNIRRKKQNSNVDDHHDNENSNENDSENNFNEELDSSQSNIHDPVVAPPTGTISYSSLPRAFWVTLFHYDQIKKKNKPQEAPQPPTLAPFFLPSVHRQGAAAPQFPTPEEFSQLSGSSTSTELKLKSSSSDNLSNVPEKKSPSSDEDIMKELAGMGTAWSDVDDNEEEGEEQEQEDQENDQGKEAVDDDVEVYEFGIDNEPLQLMEKNDKKRKRHENNSNSRIIRRQTVAPRCSLVAFLMNDFPLAFVNGSLKTAGLKEILDSYLSSSEFVGAWNSSILRFLKQSPPPVIDLEFRSLCRHEDDIEGLELLRLMILWFTLILRSGQDYEVLQAYLHRFLEIYSDIILKNDIYEDGVKELTRFEMECSERFRKMIQKNLCLLKMFAHLPTI